MYICKQSSISARESPIISHARVGSFHSSPSSFVLFPNSNSLPPPQESLPLFSLFFISLSFTSLCLFLSSLSSTMAQLKPLPIFSSSLSLLLLALANGVLCFQENYKPLSLKNNNLQWQQKKKTAGVSTCSSQKSSE